MERLPITIKGEKTAADPRSRERELGYCAPRVVDDGNNSVVGTIVRASVHDRCAKASEPCGDDDVAGPRQSRQASKGTASAEPAISAPTVYPRPITLATDKAYDTGDLSNASGRSRPVPATFTLERRDFLHPVRQFMSSWREALVQAIDLPSGATYWQTNCIPFKLHSDQMLASTCLTPVLRENVAFR